MLSAHRAGLSAGLWPVGWCLVLGCLCFCAPSRAEDKKPLPEFSEKSWNELKLELVPETKDAQTGFVVGGVNATKLIATLPAINERTIAELEKDMRPGANSEVGSRKGFIGETEKLLDVLVADNKFVVDEQKLTHQALARHLLALAAIGAKVKEEEFRYHGDRFKVTLVYARGEQLSPFYDDTKTKTVATVRNLDRQTELTYSLLVPQMIERYGFYEGTGTPYRVPPQQILKLLGFLTVKPAK